MEHVGIRRLQDRLTGYLRRMRAGRSLLSMNCGTPTAPLAPAMPELRAVSTLLAEGIAEWRGSKPRGTSRPPKVRGEPVFAVVVAGRR